MRQRQPLNGARLAMKLFAGCRRLSFVADGAPESDAEHHLAIPAQKAAVAITGG